MTPPAALPSSTTSGCSITVDARALRHSGIGRYLREILRGLLADPRFPRVVLAGEVEPLRAFAVAAEALAKVELVPLEHSFYSPAAHLRWAALELQGRFATDVAFFPHYDVPLASRNRRNVVAVQDLTHFRLPHLFPAAKRAVASAVLKRAVERSAAIVTLSEFTRRDLSERHPDVAGRIEVIPGGVSSDFAAGAAASSVSGTPIERLQPYLLCVGNRKPHKNLGAAVEALAGAMRRWPELRLVIVGPAFGDEAVARAATDLGVRDRVTELDEVSEEELRALYRGAEALLFPSLYEGFGLPILEAMSFGLPVVASNRASVPEVVGKAGIIADPAVSGAFAEAVLRLRDEPGLRERLKEAGRARAAALRWDAARTVTADLLLRVAAMRGR